MATFVGRKHYVVRAFGCSAGTQQVLGLWQGGKAGSFEDMCWSVLHKDLLIVKGLVTS